MSFDELGLSEKVLQAVTASGYTEPTPIQAQAIPHVLARKDVLGIAQTGTGKTAAFVLPMLTMLESGRARARMPRTLILEPTRELAAQVVEHFERYGINHRLSVALLIGGVSFGDQDAKITRGVDVLIATPGRLLDHFERGKLLLSGVELLVIDEADRAASAASTITQRLVATGREPHEKRETLRDLIRGAKDLRNAIIFCNRKRDVAVLHRSLQTHSFNAAALHGDMDQRARMAALEGFRTGETTILVASDVAARGLDIPAVSHVINYDVPHHAEDYVHRIGRTGRAGLSGTAFTLVGPGDEKSLGAIRKLIQQDIEWEGPESAPSTPGDRPRHAREGRGRGERGGGEERGGRRPERRPRSEGGRGRRGEPRSADAAAEPRAAAEVEVRQERAP